jgi:hypothetical protein
MMETSSGIRTPRAMSPRIMPSASRSFAQKIAVGLLSKARNSSTASSPAAKVIVPVVIGEIFSLRDFAAAATPLERSAACGIVAGPQTQAMLV